MSPRGYVLEESDLLPLSLGLRCSGLGAEAILMSGC